MDIGKSITLTVFVSVAFIILGSLVIPNYADATDYTTTSYEDVNTSSEWTDAINSSQSSNYDVTNGLLTLTGDTGSVQTVAQSTDAHDRLVINVSHLTADTDIKVYDASDDTQLDSVSATGEETVTLQVNDYSADSYYLTLDATTTTDAEVDGYISEGQDDVGDNESTFLYLVLILSLIGLGLGLYSRMT